jgi:hypothetical protein
MLREPTQATAVPQVGTALDGAATGDAIPMRHGSGAVPPVLHDKQAPPGERTASETAYADAPEPEKLPGRMYTVTLYDKRGNQIGKTLTEPLYEDIDGDLFYGAVGTDGAVHWKDEGVELDFSLKVGAKLGDNGTPEGGIPVERWARQVAKSNLGAILVQIDGATAKGSDVPALYALDDSNEKTPAATTGTNASTQGDDRRKPSTGTEAGTAATGTDAGTGPADHGRRGTTSERGHTGTGTGSEPTRGGDTSDGHKRGKAGATHDGSNRGTDFGDEYDANYFYDPSKADLGSDVLAPEGAVVGGMVGGKPHSTDEGIPQGGWFELVSVPRNIAPAVSAGIILMDADIAGLGVDVLKASIKLGRKAAGKAGALAKVITQKLEGFAERETAKLAKALSKDATFASKTASEQAAILSEARAGIMEEANRKLAAELDAKIAEHKAFAAQDATRTDGFADEFVEQDLANARAAQDARDSLPEVKARPAATEVEDAAKASEPERFSNKFPDDEIGPPVQIIKPANYKTKTGTFNYVVTEEGELIIGKIDQASVGGGHIDLAGGRDVLAAGEVKMVRGEVHYVDNSSGHYLPTGDGARQAAEGAFERAGLKVNGKYVDKVYDEARKKWVRAE